MPGFIYHHTMPPEPIRSIARFLTWLITTVPQLPDSIRRKFVEWSCTHTFIVVHYAKGVDRVFYIEQCKRCEKQLPINELSRDVWEQMRMDARIKKQKYTPTFLKSE